MKKLNRILAVILFAVCFVINLQISSAATAVVVFAPGCKYMTENFHPIAEALIKPYFDSIWIGPDVDELYSNYSNRARKHFDETFAAEYGYDYLIQIYVASPSSWKGTHTNAHTGHQSDLAIGGLTVHMVSANAHEEPGTDYFTGPGAGFYSNHGKWRNMELTTWNLYDEVFIEDLSYLVNMHYEYYWPVISKH